MKCKQCGTEFEGKFCTECGAKTEAEMPITPTPTQQQTSPMQIGKSKKKKPFFLRWWFFLIAIIVVGIIALSSSNDSEKIVWDAIILGDILPKSPASKGEIHTNSAEELWIEINDLSDKQFNDYISACKEKGFTVDAESNSSSYVAYNSEGYKLSLSHYGSNADMRINLEVPMEMSAITWPKGSAGKELPVPKSQIGVFSYEHDDNFSAYIGNTTKEDYSEYVNSCADKGFTIDYNKGDNYYSADNSKGWHIAITYEGGNIMSISIKLKAKENSDNSNKSLETEESKNSDTTDNEIDSDFKSAMDSYESFMNDYVAFMKKYKANPTDMSLLADYSDYLTKYADFVADFEGWENKDLNTAETAYYIDVQARVTKKLLEVVE